MRVETSQQTFEIGTARLVSDLRLWQTGHDTAARRRLTDAPRTLRSEAAAFSKPIPDAALHRAQLVDILNRPDFRGVRGPNWMDRLKQRAAEQMVELLRRLFGVSAIPAVSDTLVYVLVAAAFVAAVLWTCRWFLRPSRAEVDVPASTPALSKEWPAWWAEAHRAAAADGRWREAVHVCYWCAVSFLESNGAWRPDRSRTPREYLRLLPAGGEKRSALALLTRRFESVWYADAADARSFAEALASLEKIGCPPA